MLLYMVVGEQSRILPEDKEVVRQNILNFIMQVPPIIRYHDIFLSFSLCLVDN